jgi:SEC-C motif
MRLSRHANEEPEMPKQGRNDPCPCGSGRKTKRCCGQHRGPSEDDLARAHVAQLARQAVPDLAGLSDRALDHLWEGLMDLPGVDYSLLVTLPKLIGPDLQRLREAIEHDDPDWGWDALTAVHKQIDTPRQRARLADAIVRLRDQGHINRRQAAYALLDLSTSSTRFVAASLLEAVAVSAGASRTPGGLHIAA